jgi:hypothetical protein
VGKQRRPGLIRKEWPRGGLRDEGATGRREREVGSAGLSCGGDRWACHPTVLRFPLEGSEQNAKSYDTGGDRRKLSRDIGGPGSIGFRGGPRPLCVAGGARRFLPLLRLRLSRLKAQSGILQESLIVPTRARRSGRLHVVPPHRSPHPEVGAPLALPAIDGTRTIRVPLPRAVVCG